MTISDAFNEITVAQGGTASKDGTITGAIDALNDALAGSDQERAETIEDAVRLLGAHIGGGAGDCKMYVIYDANVLGYPFPTITIGDEALTLSDDTITIGQTTYDCKSATVANGSVFSWNGTSYQAEELVILSTSLHFILSYASYYFLAPNSDFAFFIRAA